MDEHPRVTEDPVRNAELVAAYDAAPDTGPAFTAHIRGLGFAPPDRPEVITWGFCVVYDEREREWLAWDAEEVRYPPGAETA